MTSIAALKSAYSTLSDVLVEETDVCRADVHALRDRVASRERELSSAKDDIARLNRTHRALEDSLSDLRREDARLDSRCDAVTAGAASQVAATSATVGELTTHMSTLLARVAAVEERAATAESVAREVAMDNARLRGALEDLNRIMERSNRDGDAHMSRLSDSLADVAARSSSGLERVRGDVASLASKVDASVASASSHTRSTSEAHAALAKDILMLAEAVSSLKSSSAAEASATSSKLRALTEEFESSRKWEGDERERRLNALAARLNDEIDGTRASIREVQDALRAASVTSAETQRSTATAAATNVSSMKAAIADIAKRVDETSSTTTARVDALTNAMHAFAKVR